MKISDLIKKLEEAQAKYGDHPLTTFDGFISRVKFTPAKDGICYPLKPGSHDEIGIDIFTVEKRPVRTQQPAESFDTMKRPPGNVFPVWDDGEGNRWLEAVEIDYELVW